MIRAKNPFIFQTGLNLLEITGEKAKNLKELADLIENAHLSVIYYHTHHFLPFQQHVSPKSPNDFAYWIKKELHEEVLSEKIIALDLQKPLGIRELKEKMLQLIKKHFTNDEYRAYDVRSGKEFNFIKAKIFIMPIGHKAYDLSEFYDVLKGVSIDSIYLHLFGVDPSFERCVNHFSCWLRDELKEEVLADCISQLDPFVFYATGTLRFQLIRPICKRLKTVKI
ncbi:DUF5752 family protein [Candidatus Oleimmundimicrobium sp.]|uniref:DUF5752 family protein n=1 Tax=Candidatus Oleimmundimicrobium sp. TaxID=3060597 RepID=UPI00271A0516|nr:DUF5752 family protein [Candidatus Oleimmundimicrobium sp.]MDO8886541.1 DUF5752 family protein [Candidatus Oleimmundimicrobium sp.]